MSTQPCDLRAPYRADGTETIKRDKPVTKKTGRKPKWTTNDQIDAAIIRAYQTHTPKGSIKRLCNSIGRPNWWVTKRALQLGVGHHRCSRNWTDPELEILEANSHKQPRTISKILKNAGFFRTEYACQVQLNRMGITRHSSGREYTANGLSRCMGVTPNTVLRWINQGYLFASRQGTNRTAVQGGDHYRIKRKEVKRFLTTHPAVWDHRKADKFWLIDILSGGSI